MITLEWPLMLALLPLPLVVWLLLPRVPQRRAGAVRLPFFGELAAAGLVVGGRPRWRAARLALLALVWLLLVFAAARPVLYGTPVPVATEGRDLMLAVGLSASMAQEDLRHTGPPANRLQVAKAALDDFLAARTGDRVGLVLFGSRAYIQAPLTLDRTVVRGLLSQATIGGANAMGDAIGIAVKALKDHPAKDRVLVVLTDGVTNAGVLQPMLAAEVARSEHVKIHTIGLGSDSFILMPGQFMNPPPELDEEMLTAVASLSGGRYFRARDELELATALAQIDRLDPATGNPPTFRPSASLFQWPLGAALVLSMVLASVLLMPAFALRAGDAAAAPETLPARAGSEP